MVQKANLHRGLGGYLLLSLGAAVLLLLLLVILLTGCSEPTVVPSNTINLATDVLTGTQVLDVQRIDADSDGEAEWLAFYQYDQVGGRGPIAAVIYDVVRNGTFPVIYPYRLRTPNETYLALTSPKAKLVDVVDEPNGIQRKELMIYTETEMAFYSLNSEAWGKTADDPALYRCVGFFHSDTEVSFDPETRLATVVSQAGYERSQLVTRHYYRPEADGFFITGTYTLVPPAASRIEFPSGIPDTILDTPYPEKIVLAFYQTFGKTNPKPTIDQYLTSQAAQQFAQGNLWYGLPSNMGLAQLKNVAVKELSYYPTQESSTSTVVIVKVVFNTISGEQSPLTTVLWTLTRSGTQWKMQASQP
jgi:hypothetical protein